MAQSDRHYIPAAGRHWRLPFYDLMAKLVGADSARRAFVEHVAPSAGDRVLDIGCGTGSLTIELKRRAPRATVVGLDPDPRALAIARRKAERAALTIRFDEGFGDALPYPDGSFDRVTSSLMFHHLAVSEKERTLREVRRVLAPGGAFYLLDFDGPAGDAGFLTRRLHAHPHLLDNAEERVLAFIRAAGFDAPRMIERRAGRLTRMCWYEARMPRVGIEVGRAGTARGPAETLATPTA